MARLSVDQAVGRLDTDPGEAGHEAVVPPTLVVRGATGTPSSPKN